MIGFEWLRRQRRSPTGGTRPPDRTTRTAGLAQLSETLSKAGWSTLWLIDEPYPRLRVFSPAAPCFGETVMLVPGTVPTDWWYLSSTGETLARYPNATTAANRITEILNPLVLAALAETTRHTRTPPARPRHLWVWMATQDRRER